MSFGYSIGDVITIAKLACDVYNAYKDAPATFRNISQEIQSLHIIIAREKDRLGKKTFDQEDEEDLRNILQGCESVLRDLDNLLIKYKSLAVGDEPVSKFVVRVKLGFEDISELRARLVSNTLLFNTFITRFAMDEMKDLIIKGPGVSGLRRAGSIASLVSFAPSLNSKETWKKLYRDLHEGGVTSEVIRERGADVLAFLQRGTAPSEGSIDSQSASTSQASRLEQNEGELSKQGSKGKSRSVPPIEATLGEEDNTIPTENETEINGAASQIIIDGTLAISFRRTVRIPDDVNVYHLPPGLGHFPLFNVEAFKSSLPQDMVEKGGMFFPMYQREAMWIHFERLTPDWVVIPYAIRVFVGGVNGITGEPMVPDMSTLLKSKNGVPLKQDYIVVPPQKWLEGVAVAPGTVRQFVAMPTGTGYSVEHQLTGKENVGGVQLEIIPRKRRVIPPRQVPPRPPGAFNMYFKMLTSGYIFTLWALDSDTIGHIKERIHVHEDIPADQQRFIFAGRQLEDGYSLSHYKIQPQSIIHLVLRLSGGGYAEPFMMSLGAGGKITQDIESDFYPADIWDTDRSRIINIQVVNAIRFEEITGMLMPPTPISVQTYADAGLPFFQFLNEDPSTISGDFRKLRSVSQITRAILSSASKDITYQPTRPQVCNVCSKALADCVIRPCNHTICRSCAYRTGTAPAKRCKFCRKTVSRVVGVAAPMMAPNFETLNKKLPITGILGEVKDGRMPFKSMCSEPRWEG